MLLLFILMSEKSYYKIKRLLIEEGWKEQGKEVYINGTIGTNFSKAGQIIHLAIDLFADEELLDETTSS